MVSSGPPPPSATSLGKRKWQPSLSSDAVIARGESSFPWEDSPSRTRRLDNDATSKKPKLLGVAREDPGSSLSGDIVMHDHLSLPDLPHEILQHVFSFVDPISLGRLMCVNRPFRILLDPAMPLPQPSGQVKSLSMRRQDQVWATSRKNFLPGFPKPMEGATELDMWKLIRGHACQFCGMRPLIAPPTPGSSPWNAGPASNGVRPIWPFRIRSCGSCLEQKIIKESELLLSSSNASILRPGLPFAIFSSSMDYIPSTVLQQMDPPPQLKVTKYYYIPQLDEMQLRMKEVQGFGPAATEGWYKGLEEMGQLLNADAARLDQWELQGGFAKLSHLKAIGPSNASSSHRVFVATQPNPITPPDIADHLKQLSATAGPSVLHSFTVEPRGKLVAIEVVSDRNSGGARAASQRDLPGVVKAPRPLNRNKSGRTPEEVERTKLERRKEIERRCQQLLPPIMPATLEFMDAFQAALQISLPMDDNQWEVLKPRLLAQRMEALRKQDTQERLSRDPAAQLEERQLIEQESRVAQDNVDHMWSVLKIPCRDKISQYARKFIQITWSDGNGVTKGTSSKFAAEVLCHVRQQFEDGIDQEDRMLELKGTAFPQDSDSLALRKLRLEDMKWTFEEFVKPHTEKFGKDLFLCSVCDNNQKLFSFEAVIQHYAAKHTHAFSRGNAVVSWKAEWPLEPPFDPSPNIPWVRDGSQPIAHMRMQAPYNSRAWTAPTEPVPASTSSHQSYVNEIVGLVRELWHVTDAIHNLSQALRVWVVIQLTCTTFSQRFNDDLSLHLFLSCIQNRSELQFLSGLGGLQCNACSTRPEPSPRTFDGWFPSDRSLAELLTHFQRMHIDFDASSHTEYGILSSGSRTSTSSTRLDWKRDMILLPSWAEIQAFLHAPTTDSHKVQLIADALNAPAFTLPKRAGPSSQMSVSDNVLSPYMQQDVHPRPTSRHSSVRDSRPGYRVARSEVSMPASEEEYDPHRPAPASSMPRATFGQSQRLPSTSHGSRVVGSIYQPLQLSEHREYPFRVHSDENRWSLAEHRRLVSAESSDPQLYDRGWSPNRGGLMNRSNLAVERPRSIGSRPESKATSHHSLQPPGGAEVPATIPTNSTQPVEVGRPREDSAAMDFLNNFDPTALNNDGNPEFAASESRRGIRGPTARETLDAREATAQDAGFPYIRRNGSVRQGFDDQIVKQHPPSVPMREDGRFEIGEIDYESRMYHQSLLSPAEEPRPPRGIGMGSGYVDDISRVSYRSREGMYMTRVQDQGRNYQEFGYESRGYYEEKFARPGPRYEAVAQPPMELYHHQSDRPDGEFVEMHRARQQIATEEDGYDRHREGRTRYVPARPIYYDEAEDIEYAPVRERTVTYANYHDAQYNREDTLEAGQVVHAGQRDSRLDEFRPGDENRRYMTR
ncbi:uncharacterized protein A1O9_03884 [Exophiala aquamarina CBS 119918]|uniref:F-box domain-containing protein n=1 Tax=Exophiala aquamarina CBS 119918 TaxID=1182545 RepID=A0A072PGP8_9EURO|nr:uncharacterized protein A1O9_03884 [Exophiala aquamarina CBS 119918]KEF59041.1 hypothetical protein A1O9_03884 [Exophiala aquamarina CBS 119918]